MPKKVKFSRAQGASSGVESYAFAAAILLLLVPLVGAKNIVSLCLAMFVGQVAYMASIDRKIMWTFATSQKFGPATCRNGAIGFAECVRPGGKPTSEHALSLYKYSALTTSVMFGSAMVVVLTLNPIVAFIRPFYTEHREGVNKNDWFGLIRLFLRHPMAVQGEGPSNGDGLAAMCASESLIYPVTPKSLELGPRGDYWVKEGGPPRWRDMFHDKMFVHRFFEAHGAPHPVLVMEVVNHKVTEVVTAQKDAPKKLIWKPRYSTMSLGVEHFQGWEDQDKEGWAPSSDPYIVEEYVASTEYPDAAEWFRMTTLWRFGEKEPFPGYIWRARNDKGDTRVQTDIIGGAYCITSKHTPFVGPTDRGTTYDPRTNTKGVLDRKVDKALSKAIDLQLKMHKVLGNELYSIGWDVLVREEEPIFIEFNINNGFFVADHSVAEVEQMIAYFDREFNARIDKQLHSFDHKA